MSGAQNWREETNAQDYFSHQQKQVQLSDRRPVIRRASDLVGPGVGAAAVRLTDLNDVLATFNGFFSCLSTASNAPNATQSHVGFVSSDSEIGGIQMFYGLSDGIARRRIFTRNPADPSSIVWGTWAAV
jgi:hypothetical protein